MLASGWGCRGVGVSGPASRVVPLKRFNWQPLLCRARRSRNSPAGVRFNAVVGREAISRLSATSRCRPVEFRRPNTRANFYCKTTDVRERSRSTRVPMWFDLNANGSDEIFVTGAVFFAFRIGPVRVRIKNLTDGRGMANIARSKIKRARARACVLCRHVKRNLNFKTNVDLKYSKKI